MSRDDTLLPDGAGGPLLRSWVDPQMRPPQSSLRAAQALPQAAQLSLGLATLPVQEGSTAWLHHTASFQSTSCRSSCRSGPEVEMGLCGRVQLSQDWFAARVRRARSGSGCNTAGKHRTCLAQCGQRPGSIERPLRSPLVPAAGESQRVKEHVAFEPLRFWRRRGAEGTGKGRWEHPLQRSDQTNRVRRQKGENVCGNVCLHSEVPKVVLHCWV